MTHSPFDSDIFGDLFGDPVIGALMSDDALIRSMMKVEGHLAQVQGALGIVPEPSAAAIFKASSEIEITPADLSDGTRSDGIPVPVFVRIFREKMEAGSHAQYVHWGATSQDILDTALPHAREIRWPRQPVSGPVSLFGAVLFCGIWSGLNRLAHDCR